MQPLHDDNVAGTETAPTSEKHYSKYQAAFDKALKLPWDEPSALSALKGMFMSLNEVCPETAHQEILQAAQAKASEIQTIAGVQDLVVALQGQILGYSGSRFTTGSRLYKALDGLQEAVRAGVQRAALPSEEQAFEATFTQLEASIVEAQHDPEMRATLLYLSRACFAAVPQVDAPDLQKQLNFKETDSFVQHRQKAHAYLTSAGGFLTSAPKADYIGRILGLLDTVEVELTVEVSLPAHKDAGLKAEALEDDALQGVPPQRPGSPAKIEPESTSIVEDLPFPEIEKGNLVSSAALGAKISQLMEKTKNEIRDIEDMLTPAPKGETPKLQASGLASLSSSNREAPTKGWFRARTTSATKTKDPSSFQSEAAAGEPRKKKTILPL